MIVTDDEGWLFYRGLDNSLRVLTELLLTIPEHEIQETKVLIERGKRIGRELWIEKNENLLHRLEDILIVLKDGKICHKAGKKGREYTGKERENQ